MNRTTSPLRPVEIRTAASGAAGSALEYYDFAIYGALAATLFPVLFFDNLGETAGLLTSLATFGVGFVARPLGAIVFGHLGDKIGRKPVLIVTLALMGVASVLIGLLPTSGGVAPAAALVALRLLQGFALGGEITGNQLMIVEHADRTRRGFLGAFNVVGGPAAQVMATLLLLGLQSTLSDEQFNSWGWRIPFLVSIGIVAVAFVIRRLIEETPAFETAKIAQQELAEVDAEATSGMRMLRPYWRIIALMTLTWGGPACTFFIVVVYGLNYLRTDVGVSAEDALRIVLIGNAVSCVTAFVGGHLSDRVGRKPIMVTGILSTFVGVVAFFTVADAHIVVAGVAVTWVLSSIQLAAGAQPAFFAEQLPSEVRYTGGALAYNFANLIFSAPAPFLAAALAASGGAYLVMVYPLVVLLASAIAASRLREGGHLDLETFAEAIEAKPSHPQTTPVE